jgi:ABC-type Fe3+-siderophore transport system permease subunit
MLAGLPAFIFLGLVYSRVLMNEDRLERVILLGLTFNLFVGAIFSLWQFFFMAFNQPFPVEVWFGHFRHASGSALILLLIAASLFIFGFSLIHKELSLFSLSSNLARNYQLKRKKFFAIVFILSVCSTFIVVGLYGAFSFLGLIFPILARKLWFSRFDLQGEFYWGSVFNGLILMMIDYLCFAFPIMGAEVPVGLLVTAVGAVSLILLLWRGNHGAQLLAKFGK